MINVIEYIYANMFYFVALFCVPFLILFSIVMYLGVVRQSKQRAAKYAAACFVNLIVIGILVTVLNFYAAEAVTDEIERISLGEEFSVIVNNEPFDMGESLVLDIIKRDVKPKVSGSSPKKKILVSVQSSLGEVNLEFNKDSRDKNLYWVWYTGYRGSLNGSFFVETRLLDSI